MAIDSDDPVALPPPPPPRPAARKEAIEMALRKFDGVEEAPRRSTARSRPPFWSAAWFQLPAVRAFAAAGLVAAVSIPLAQTVVRETWAPREEPRPETGPRACQGAECVAAEADRSTAGQAEVAASPAADAAPPPENTAAAVPSDAAADAARPMRPGSSAASAPVVPAELAPPPVAPSAPPPPPPPAAPAPQFAEEVADHQIVVTGSRVARPSLSSPSAVQAVSGASRKPDNAAEFLSRLQAAFRSGDRRAIVALIDYPLRVQSRSGPRTYRSAQDIEGDFDGVFTPQVRQSVLQARTATLTADGSGLNGTGRIWFGPTCPNRACSPPGDYRIKRVTP